MLNLSLSLNGGEEAVVAEGVTLYDWRTDSESDWIMLRHEYGLGKVAIERAEAVKLAQAILAAAYAEGQDQAAIARWEEGQDARADAVSAHWGHD